MNRYLSKLRAVAGFTMIELLVVISVIGVLAVAVLSSINPIEQINKGRDVRANSDAAQLVNAIDRYYATQEKYPWNVSTYCAPNCAATTGDPSGVDSYLIPSSAFPGPDTAGVSNGACDSTLIAVANTNGGSGTKPTYGVGMCKIGAVTTLGAAGSSAWLTALSTESNEVKDSFVSRLRATGDAGGQQPMFVSKPYGAQTIVSVCFKPISTGFKKDALDTCLKYKSGQAIASTLGLPDMACPVSDYTGLTITSSNVGSELICLPFGKAK